MRKFLENAILSKSTIEIVYYGGSEPGSKHKIIPLIIDFNYLHAIDLERNQNKMFLIDKITLETDHEKFFENEIYVISSKINSIVDIESFYKNHKIKFIEQGWLPQFNSFPMSIKLFSFYKNGNIKKSPDIYIIYDEFILESVLNTQSMEFEYIQRNQAKPFKVYSKIGEYKEYLYLSTALEEFLTLAKEHSPKLKLE